MKHCFKYPGFLEVSKFWQLFVFVLNCLLFPSSLHFLFEGCTLSESIGSTHTIHQLLPVAFAVAVRLSLYGCHASLFEIQVFQSYRNCSNTFGQYQQPSFLQIMHPDVQMVTIECPEIVIQRYKLWLKSVTVTQLQFESVE